MKKLAVLALLSFTTPLLAQPEGGTSQNPADGFMMQFDSNKDDRVTLQEFKDPQLRAIEQQFGYMDKNQDGKIDRSEIEAFGKEMQERMQQMRQQQGGQQR